MENSATTLTMSPNVLLEIELAAQPPEIDTLLDDINGISATELDVALDGILNATRLSEAVDLQISTSESVIPFGEQLMEPTTIEDRVTRELKDGDSPLTPGDPAPTMSGGTIKKMDDGGTGPGEER
jgi:hypothetical protein